MIYLFLDVALFKLVLVVLEKLEQLLVVRFALLQLEREALHFILAL